MLHSESRKDGAQGYRALTASISGVVASAVLVVVLTSCMGGKTREDAETISAQLFALNAQPAHECLEQFLYDQPDTLQADRAARRYYEHGGRWLWAAEPDMTGQARQVALYLRQHVGEMGFAHAAFFLNEIDSGIERLDSLRFDSVETQAVVMARTELMLTHAYLRYVRGQRYGFTNPSRLLNRLDLRDGRPGDYRQLFDVSVEQPDSLFFERALRRASEGDALGFMRETEPRDSLYRRYVKELARDSVYESRRRLMCNMERRRWRTDEGQGTGAAGGRHIFVNLPAQTLWAIAPDSVFSMRICFGAWATKTPLLNSAVSLIEINPEWVIPGSIVRGEVSRHAGDSAYFARHRYFITNRQTGDTIDPRRLSPTQLASGSYRVAQQSGRGNSLGRIIFRFPNQHAVYLHDTNNPGAFNAERRSVSHGCIRVQRPFDLALFLMPDADEWLLDRMRLSMDMAPQSEKGKNYLKQRAETGDTSPIRLIRSTGVAPKVPVSLSYYTVYPNPETGVMETWPDRYEYDKQLLRALNPYLKP